MRKTKIILISIFISLMINESIFAINNQQYIISVDESEEIIDAITFLYIKSNYAIPSMSAPYSVSELNIMLNNINFNSLDKLSKNKYNYVKNKLLEKTYNSKNIVEFNLNGNFNFESYLHNNEIDFIGKNSWIRGWSDQKNIINLNLEFFGGDFFYGMSSLSVGSARINEIPFGSSSFQTNILGTTDLDISRDINSNFPQRAFLSFGGNNWNIEVGRDKIDWGAGISGNLLISDNLKYQDFARVSIFGDKYKYSYLASFFPHQLNYIKTSDYDLNTSQWDPLQGFSMFVVHRFEGRSFKNRLGWAFSEGVIYASEDSTIDIKAFNPMLSYHSIFAKANCNSIISLDFDFSFNYSTNIYTQIVIDDLIVPNLEKADIYSPNAIGIIFGIKKDYSTDNLSLLSTVEFAYTSPYLYLRDNGKFAVSKDNMQSGYGINFIVALREFSNTRRESGIIYDKQFLGYKYGGDALVFDFNNKYKIFNDRLEFQTNLFTMIHGVNSIDTLWSPVGGNVDNPGFLSFSNYDETLSGLSFTGVLGFSINFEVTSHVSTFAQLDFVSLYNDDHMGASSNDIQLTSGFSFSY